ncbi:MAG TPA: hypothetical protein VGC29_08470 [Flavisolibacter sp.]
MRKIALLFIFFTAALLQFCSPARRARKEAPKVTYENHLQPIIVNNCSPCHIPPKGNKEPLNTYEAVKKNIDESIRRINLNPGEKGFMPFKHAKLPDSTIQVFVQWKNDGMIH